MMAMNLGGTGMGPTVLTVCTLLRCWRTAHITHALSSTADSACSRIFSQGRSGCACRGGGHQLHAAASGCPDNVCNNEGKVPADSAKTQRRSQRIKTKSSVSALYSSRRPRSSSHMSAICTRSCPINAVTARSAQRQPDQHSDSPINTDAVHNTAEDVRPVR